MALVIIPYRFVVKRDMAANFVAANTLLLEGEFGLELDTGLGKMGDGVTPWNSLTEYQLPGLFDLTGLAEGSLLRWAGSAGLWVVDNSAVLESVVAGDGIDVDATDPANPIVSIEDTAVTPGSYTYASITVGQDGRLTAATNGTSPGTGDVVGPASAVDDRIATFDGTSGKLIQDGGKTIADLRAPAIQTVASSATVTPTFADDMVTITAQAAALALANPTGTAIPGLGMVIRIKDNGTARAISYDTQYRAIGVTLPTTTVINKTLYLACIWNSTDTKFDVLAVGQEA